MYLMGGKQQLRSGDGFECVLHMLVDRRLCFLCDIQLLRGDQISFIVRMPGAARSFWGEERVHFPFADDLIR